VASIEKNTFGRSAATGHDFLVASSHDVVTCRSFQLSGFMLIHEAFAKGIVQVGAQVAQALIER
jgi:hypothetical protein